MTDLSSQFYGAGADDFFKGAPKAPAPFPGLAKNKRFHDYDQGVVREALSSSPNLTDVDPRTVHATQPWVTQEGVKHYLSGEYERTGKTFADSHDPGNTYPLVYERRGEGIPDRNILLSGHHRATAALLQGRQFKAMVVKGGFGGPRGR